MKEVTGHRSRNTVLGGASIGLQAVAFVLLTPIIARAGPAVLSAWSVTSAILAWVSLMDFGVSEATALAIANIGGSDADRASVHHLRDEARRRLTHQGLTAIGPALIISGLLASIVNRGGISSVSLGAYWGACVTAYLVALPAMSLSAVHLARGELWATQLPSFVETLVQAIVSATVMFHAGPPLLILTIAFLLARAAGVCARLVLFRKVIGALPSNCPPRQQLASLEVPRSTHFFVAGLATRVIFASDVVVLAIYRQPKEVGAYAFAFRVVYTVLQVLWLTTDHYFAILGKLRMPSFTDSNPRALLRRQVRDAMLLVVPIAVICAVVYPAAARRLSSALTPPAGLAELLAIFMVVHTSVHVLALSDQALGGSRSVARIVSIDACVNLVLSLALVGHYGSRAILGATILANLVVSLPFLFVLAARLSRRSIA